MIRRAVNQPCTPGASPPPLKEEEDVAVVVVGSNDELDWAVAVVKALDPAVAAAPPRKESPFIKLRALWKRGAPRTERPMSTTNMSSLAAAAISSGTSAGFASPLSADERSGRTSILSPPPPGATLPPPRSGDDVSVLIVVVATVDTVPLLGAAAIIAVLRLFLLAPDDDDNNVVGTDAVPFLLGIGLIAPTDPEMRRTRRRRGADEVNRIRRLLLLLLARQQRVFIIMRDGGKRTTHPAMTSF